MSDDMIEITAGATVWRFDTEFLRSNWTCIYGDGCRGITDEPDSIRGCCTFGAHLGDGSDGRTEALNLAAYASVLTAEQWERHGEFAAHGSAAIFSDERRNHTRVVDGACVFLNGAGFGRGPGCALHVGAIDAGESPVDWKPGVCWQLPIRVDWDGIDETSERATVRRWGRSDWGEFADSMAWCCTERSDGGEAYCGDRPVIESLEAELTEVVGEAVMVELRRRLA